MKPLLIMNPGSRAGHGQRLWQCWEAGLQAAGQDYACACTEYPGHAFTLAREARGVDTVVAVGGDGTINEVLDGVMQSGNPALRMGVLYSGTSPDFCRFHRIPCDPTQAIRALLQGQAHKVDVARITYHDAEGTERTAHFGCSCNIGLGASIARLANRWRPFIGDVPGTGAAAVRTLLTHRRVDLALKVDGVSCDLPQVNNLTIAKNPFLASGLQLKLDLQPDDGALCVVGIHEQSRAGMFHVLPRCYSGTVTGIPGVLVTRCHAITVQAREAQEIEFDGDPRGYLPASIEVLPQALWLIGGGYA